MQQEDIKQLKISSAVINRLPRYYRYLKQLLSENRLRISSLELAKLMKVTASQIRQDLNCFGGFGQQGYGYNVKLLFGKISEILGAKEGYTAIIVGAGHLGHALAAASTFNNRGVELKALFDIDPRVIGTACGELMTYSMDSLEDYCNENRVDIAVLTVPKNCAVAVARRLAETGVRGVWNFTGVELELPAGVSVQNVHLGDKLMTLCYDIKNNQQDED